MQESHELDAPTGGQPEEQQTAGNERPGAEAQPTSRPAGEGSPEEQLRRALEEAAEHHDAWLRARAEADNIRKRAQAEIAGAHKFAIESFASELLAVKDSLEAALSSDKGSVDAVMSGVELTLKQLKSVFDKFSLSEINPAGEKFDPHRHQAITVVESDAAPNTVVQVLQKGYLLHDRVIRPALVTVAKGVES